MTIYSGSVSHKNGIGRVREAVATDNTALARAFGVDGVAGETYSNGKIGMLQLSGEASHAQIAIDPAEMKREDDMSYVRSHLASIVNFEQLAVAISHEYRAELSAILHQIDSKLQFNTLTNANRALVVKVLLDVLSIEDIKRELIGNNNEQALIDTIKRNATAIFYEQDSQVGGIDYSLTARGTTDVDVKKSAHKISVRIKIKGTTNGSASSAGSAFKQNFVDIKKTVTMVGAQDYVRTVVYNENYDVENIVQDVINVVSQFARETVRRAVRDINDKYADVENYNPAGAKSRLWNELGITVSDIPQTSIPDVPLRQYANKEITALQFANLPETNFGLRFAKATAKRIENADVEMIAEAYVDKTFNNLPEDVRQEKISDSLKDVENAVDKVSQNVLSITEFNEAYKLYQSSNQTFVDMIMQQLNPSDENDDVAKLAPAVVSLWTQETAKYVTDELIRKSESLLENIGYTNVSLVQPALQILNLSDLANDLAVNLFENELREKVEELRTPEEISIALIGQASLTVNYDNILQKHFVKTELTNKLLAKYEQTVLDQMNDELHHKGINTTNAQIINALRNAYSGRYNQMVLNNKDSISTLVSKVEKPLERENSGTIDNATYDKITETVRTTLINMSYHTISKKLNKPITEVTTIANDVVEKMPIRRQIIDTLFENYSKPNIQNISAYVQDEIDKHIGTIDAQVLIVLSQINQDNDSRSENKQVAIKLVANAIRLEINRVLYQIVTVDWQAPKYIESLFATTYDENELVAEVIGDMVFDEKPNRQDMENLLRDKLPDAQLKARLLRAVNSDQIISNALMLLAESLIERVDGYGTLDSTTFVAYFKSEFELGDASTIFNARITPMAFVNKYKNELGRLLKYGDNARVIESLNNKKDKVIATIFDRIGLNQNLYVYFNESYDAFVLELVARPDTYNIDKDTDLAKLSEEQLATISKTRIIDMTVETPKAHSTLVENLRHEVVGYLSTVKSQKEINRDEVANLVNTSVNRLKDNEVLNYAYASSDYREKLVSEIAEDMLLQGEEPDNIAIVISQLRKKYVDARDKYVEEIMGNTVNTARSLILANINQGIDEVIANVPDLYETFKKENNNATSPQLFIDTEYAKSDIDWHIAQLANVSSIAEHATEIIVYDIIAVVANITGFSVTPTLIASMVKSQMNTQVRLQTVGNEDKYIQFVKDNEDELNQSQI